MGAAGHGDKNRNCILKVSISPTDTFYIDSTLNGFIAVPVVMTTRVAKMK